MLEIKKYKTAHNYDAFTITTDEGKFEISYQPNLDLYWRYLPERNISNTQDIVEFSITKENYSIYTLFENLYQSITDSTSFSESTLVKSEIKNYSNLFKNSFIEWYSDDFALIENASCLKIKKENESFKVIFKKSQKEPESGIHFLTYSIRISNSGSRYKPFNINFMKMYQALQEYDPEYHQIHIEEYLYEQKKLAKTKN